MTNSGRKYFALEVGTRIDERLLSEEAATEVDVMQTHLQVSPFLLEQCQSCRFTQWAQQVHCTCTFSIRQAYKPTAIFQMTLKHLEYGFAAAQLMQGHGVKGFSVPLSL